MEEIPGTSGRSESSPSEASWWPSALREKIQSVSLSTQEDILPNKRSPCSSLGSRKLSWNASQILWSTGVFSGQIPNGFYSIIPDQKLKDMFPTIPSPDALHSLEAEGLRADIIIVDIERDKKLSRLKQLSVAMVKTWNTNPALAIKKIAGLVYDFYKRPNSEPYPAKSAVEEEASNFSENGGPQLVGQIRHGSCRPRAILFKVLADAVGLGSKLVVGLPNHPAVEFMDSYKHLSVLVTLNSMELLVDLMRFPGQLIPFSAKAIFISHMSAAGESDSAENDSCDSPLEPNSPLCAVSDKAEAESCEHDDDGQPTYHHRTDNSPLLSARPLRTTMLRSRTFTDRKLSTSHSEPDIANAFWMRNSLRRGSTEAQGDNSRLDGCDGTSSSKTGKIRRRRRSMSITPEVGDNIVRAVRAMNETLKQNRLVREPVNEGSHTYSTEDPDDAKDMQTADEVSGVKFVHGESSNRATQSQRAMSLPSSPHEYIAQSPKSEPDFISKECMALTWRKVLQKYPSLNRPLIPFEEWEIDFSELTVGTRVGIGFFGEVFRGTWSGTEVAIKVFLEQDMTSENMEDFCNEVHILSRLRHPNVILFLGACMKPPHLSMVTEYMELGSLYYLIHMSGQKKINSFRKKIRILCDICRGLLCIHRMKIVHRDLKSANCLVNAHWTVKICDFGLSRVMTDAPMRDNSTVGTPEWMAPELIRNEPYTEKCDIFSLGVIMWELETMSKPWQGISAAEVLYGVGALGSRLEIPEKSPLAKLIADCWAEPLDRPTCQEVLAQLLDMPV